MVQKKNINKNSLNNFLFTTKLNRRQQRYLCMCVCLRAYVFGKCEMSILKCAICGLHTYVHSVRALTNRN